MEILWDRGIEFLIWLQATFPGLEPVMKTISDLGSFEVYLALVLWLYWCYDKVRGRRLAYLLAISNVGVNVFKHFLRGPRPFWLISGEFVGETSGYGIPSGHVATSTITYTYLAGIFRRRWFTVLAIIWIGLMATSRMYNFQHFPHDVVGGVLLATGILAGYVIWNRYLHANFKNRILGQRFWLAVLVPIAIFMVYAALVTVLPKPAYQARMPEMAQAAELFGWEDVVFSTAALMGLGIGFVLEGRDVRFLVNGSWGVKLVRFGLGLALDLAVLYGLRAVFSQIATEESNFILFLILRFIRYFLASIAAVYFIPMIFTKVGLMDFEPEPRLNASLNRVVPQKSEHDSGLGSGSY